MAKQSVLKGKLSIQGILKLETGLHIGSAGDFAPIGAVDSPFIRDPFTKEPIIPGSSLKGKLRTLLAKTYTDGYVLNEVEADHEIIKRLFGVASKQDTRPSRLQFFDLHITEDSLQRFGKMELDTYIGEIKFENTIGRATAIANPRQIERVPAGTEFDFKLVYNVEVAEELFEDMDVLANGFILLQMDYLGGHGSRGYGRVSLRDLKVDIFTISSNDSEDTALKVEQLINDRLKGSVL